VASPTHISITEAAERLGRSYRHTRRLIAEGRLRAVALDGEQSDRRLRWGVSVASVSALLAKRQVRV
jgi:excisionase family DNA binding protein